MKHETQILNGELLTEFIDNGNQNEEVRRSAEEAIDNSAHTALLFEIERLTKKSLQNRPALRISAPEELKNSIMGAIKAESQGQSPAPEASAEEKSLTDFFKNIFNSNNK